MRPPACDVLCSCGIVEPLEMTVTRVIKVTGRVERREKHLGSKEGRKQIIFLVLTLLCFFSLAVNKRIRLCFDTECVKV